MMTPKLLVIDDDPLTCNLIETILQMENYRTVSVHHIDKEGIIPILNQKAPDMLILDIHLGSVETIKYVRAIRADGSWRKLPILMTSALDRRRVCLEAGANGFILKPFNWQELTKQVNTIWGNLKCQEV